MKLLPCFWEAINPPASIAVDGLFLFAQAPASVPSFQRLSHKLSGPNGSFKYLVDSPPLSESVLELYLPAYCSMKPASERFILDDYLAGKFPGAHHKGSGR